MHFFNNGLSVLISYYPEQMEKILPMFYKDTLGVLDVVIMLVIGLVFFGLGYIVLRRKK